MKVGHLLKSGTMEIAKNSKFQKANRMRVETVLNRVQKYKSFVFSNV